MIKIGFNKDSIIFHTFTYFFICLFCIVSILYFTFFYFYKSLYWENLEQTQSKLAVNVFTDFDYIFKMFQNLINNVSTRSSIKDVLGDTEIDSLTKGLLINNEISFITEQLYNLEGYSITIFPETESVIYGSPYVKSCESIANSSWYKETQLNKKHIFFLNELDESISIVRPISDFKINQPFSNRLGIVKLDINIDSLFEKNAVNSILITDQKNNIVFNPQNQHLSDTKYTLIAPHTYESQTKHQTIYKKNYVNDSFTIHYIFDHSKENSIFLFNIFISLLITVIFLTLLIFILYRISYRLKKNIQFIAKKMENATKGNFIISEKLPGKNEFAQIDQNLNKMIEKIELLIHEKYINEIEKKSAQLQALQLQINPHFLYNTLDIINRIAITHDFKKIDQASIICQKLAKMFRYNADSSDTAFGSLFNEIEHIHNYFDIQNIRFDNNIDVFFSISPETENMSVLKFILQPIVENTFRHALKDNSKKISIVIESYTEGDTLVIEVQDDGAGMTQERLKQVTESLDTKSDSLGLANVHKRLKLAFGSSYGISVNSKLGIGTKVSLRMPATIQNTKEPENEYFNSR